MAKKKKKRRSRGKGSRRKAVKQSTSVKAVIKRQPLLVKGGILISGLEIVSKPSSLGDPIYQLTAKQYGNFLKSAKANAMDPKSYYPIVFGVLGSKAARLLGIKGM